VKRLAAMLRSLRTRIFLLIVLPLIAVALVAAVLRHMVAAENAERLYDNTLHAVGMTISRDVVLSEGDVLAEELLDSLVYTLGDPIYYRVTGPDGVFVTGYSIPPEPLEKVEPPASQPQFYDGVYYGDPVRVLTFREFIAEPEFGGLVTVQVWQTKRQREAHSWRLVGVSAAVMAAIILSAGAIVWFGINLGLKPLSDLREAVERSSPDDLGPIRRPVPPEVSSLVAAMNALFARLSSAFAQRDAFISNAAHQLRNPIAGIQAQAEAAMSAPNEAELRDRVASVAEAARRTSRLTQQLLSLEKARGRDSGQRDAEVHLEDLASTVMKAHAPGALRRGIKIDFEVEGEKAALRGDPVMISEAVDNLFDNALRYGCPQGGEVSVRVAFEPEAARLVVQDQGPGVPEDQRERIFERFHRANEDGSDGCGLGLPIVVEVAERHGGAVHLAETAKGARFDLTLPYGA
jgi:two-component system sensor histidine kinase TctE